MGHLPRRATELHTNRPITRQRGNPCQPCIGRWQPHVLQLGPVNRPRITGGSGRRIQGTTAVGAVRGSGTATSAGNAVQVASRVMGPARPNEVPVSSMVKDLVAGAEIRFEDRSVHSPWAARKVQLFAAFA